MKDFYLRINNEVPETITVNGVSFNMVRVEGGEYIMGEGNYNGDWEEEDDDFYGYLTPHKVKVDRFFIGETEVTQELWSAVMGTNPSYFKGLNRPVEQVSWDDCHIFIRELNLLTGRRLRLPTEAEWEYAARGGNKSQGYVFSGSNEIDKVAWHEGNSNKETHDVALKQANELGLYDMSGNVFEWCQDNYGPYVPKLDRSPEDVLKDSCQRVTRGGCCGLTDGWCTVCSRGNSLASKCSKLVGIRLAE